MPDRKVHAVSDEIDLLGRCGDAKINLRVSRSETSQPVHEPFRAEVRRSADGQNARWAVSKQAIGPHCNPIQRVPDNSQVFLSSAGDNQALAVAREQFETEGRFEQFHLLTYSGLADTELCCGPCEALAACRCLKGSESVQRRQAAWHRQDLGSVPRRYCPERPPNNRGY